MISFANNSRNLTAATEDFSFSLGSAASSKDTWRKLKNDLQDRLEKTYNYEEICKARSDFLAKWQKNNEIMIGLKSNTIQRLCKARLEWVRGDQDGLRPHPGYEDKEFVKITGRPGKVSMTGTGSTLQTVFITCDGQRRKMLSVDELANFLDPQLSGMTFSATPKEPTITLLQFIQKAFGMVEGIYGSPGCHAAAMALNHHISAISSSHLGCPPVYPNAKVMVSSNPIREIQPPREDASAEPGQRTIANTTQPMVSEPAKQAGQQGSADQGGNGLRAPPQFPALPPSVDNNDQMPIVDTDLLEEVENMNI